jgi:sugar phosphate isomerase/epimerase
MTPRARRENVKLSFSTLGCPDWTFEEILARGKACGFDGVGFRGVNGEIDLTKIPEFAADQLPATRQRLANAGLAPAMVLSGARLIVPAAEVEANLRVAETHVEIAAGLGAPAIRVFGGQFPIGLSRAAAVERAARRLRRLGDFASARGVAVLLETHDDFADPALLRRVLEAAGHPAVGAVWDTHHTFRIAEASMQGAWDAIGPWVRAVDIKDSITDFAAPLGYRYVPLGEGDVPVAEAVGVLRAGGYAGWLTCEWEKLWHPDLASPEIAFPQFIAEMRRLLAA